MPCLSGRSELFVEALRRLAKFAALPFIASVAPFLALPVLARNSSASEWAAIAIGQSLGGMLAVIATYGWNLVGPSRVAGEKDLSEVCRIYRDSLRVRRTLSVTCGIVSAPIVILIAPQNSFLLAWLMCVAMISGAIAPTWFLIGTGDAAGILKFDIFPRGLAVLSGAAMVALSRDAIWYPVAILLAQLVAVEVFGFARLPRSNRPQGRPIVELLKTQRDAAATVVTAGLYSSSSVVLASPSVSTQELAAFSSGERLYRVSLMPVQALSAAFQGWVGESGPQVAKSRRRVAMLFHVCLAVLGAGAVGLGGSSFGRVMFGGELAPSNQIMFGYALAFFFVANNTAIGRYFLIPSAAERTVLASTGFGAVIGATSIILLSQSCGAVGAAIGLALGEGAVLLIQLVGVIRLRNTECRGNVA